MLWRSVNGGVARAPRIVLRSVKVWSVSDTDAAGETHLPRPAHI